MSLLRRQSAPAAAQPPQVVSSDSYFIIKPQQHPGTTPSAALLHTQTQVLSNMQKQCADLFSLNPAVQSYQHNSEIFHTSQLYGDSVSVEELAHNMEQHSLCLAVNHTMPSAGSSTLGMLDHTHLTEAACRAGFVSIPTGNKGSMNVAFKQGSDGLHYIRSVDFHVN